MQGRLIKKIESKKIEDKHIIKIVLKGYFFYDININITRM